ncbi:hypothetical protein PM082_015904 [Marasmius tenuissimus]|nr:hypothetical protein PM082_015904 [Marasmius tenuissimus]
MDWWYCTYLVSRKRRMEFSLQQTFINIDLRVAPSIDELDGREIRSALIESMVGYDSQESTNASKPPSRLQGRPHHNDLTNGREYFNIERLRVLACTLRHV